MRLLCCLVAVSIATFAHAPSSWADSVPSPSGSTQSNSVEPSTASESTSSATLGTIEVGVPSAGDNSPERLNNLSNQINQGVGAQQAPQNRQGMPSLNEVINLPPGMVVRGTRGGGLAIGTEY